MLKKAKKRYTKIRNFIKYNKYKPNHVFDINVNDMSFKLTFSDYKLDDAIIERIEGRREPETTAIIKSLIRKGAKVLELGGCYGYFTTIMSRCAGENGKIVSIEGTPNNNRILTNNVCLNNLNNVDIYQYFITSKAPIVYFNPEDRGPYNAINRLGNSGAHSKSNHSKNSNYVTVEAKQLSQILSDINFTPDYIFMDIEGFEVDVFEDFSEGYFRLNRPIIVFEIHEVFYKNGKDLNYIMEILKDNDYYYRQIGGNLICFPEIINSGSLHKLVSEKQNAV